MTHPYLTGKHILLRPIESPDLDILVKFENESDSRLYGDDDVPYPVTVTQLETFIKSNEAGYNFAICRIDNKELVGSIALYGVNYQNSTCEIGLTLTKTQSNQGFGSESIELLMDFIFMYMPLNKIKLQVFGFNTKAIRLYERLSFVHEGTLKQEIFRFGTFQDLENYAYFRHMWESKKETPEND